MHVLICLALASRDNERMIFYGSDDAVSSRDCANIVYSMDDTVINTEMQNEPLNLCTRTQEQTLCVTSSTSPDSYIEPSLARKLKNCHMIGKTVDAVIENNDTARNAERHSAERTTNSERERTHKQMRGKPLSLTNAASLVISKKRKMETENCGCCDNDLTNTANLEKANTENPEYSECKCSGIDLPANTTEIYNFDKWLKNAKRLRSSKLSFYKPAFNFVNWNNSVHECKDNLRYFDFDAFYNTHKKLVSAPDISSNKLHFDCYYAKYNLSQETKNCLIGIGQILAELKYNTDEYDIEFAIENSPYSNNVRFLKCLDTKKEVINDLIMLSEPSTFETLDINDFDQIKHSYDMHIQKILHCENHAEMCSIYTNFVNTVLFSVRLDINAYVLKSEIWKIQLFMPELYFYILWKLKAINNHRNDGINIRDHCIMEMSHLFKLLQNFYLICKKSIEHQAAVQTMKSQVVLYKTFIMEYLKTYHFQTSTYYIYLYSFDIYKTKLTQLDNSSINRVLAILAFTGQSIYFKEMALQLTAKINATKEFAIATYFLHYKLLNNKGLRNDTIAVLQLISVFLTLSKYKPKMPIFLNPVLNSFKNPTVAVSYNELDNIFDVAFLPRLHILGYFDAQYLDILLN